MPPAAKATEAGAAAVATALAGVAGCRHAAAVLAGVAGSRRVAAALAGTAAVQELGGSGGLQGRLRCRLWRLQRHRHEEGVQED